MVMFFLCLLLALMMTTTTNATTTAIEVKSLPYAYDALAPAISEETMRFHHDKHYAGYVAKLNELIADTPYAGQSLEEIVLTSDGSIFNQAAQAWNHEFYFEQFAPGATSAPTGPLLDAINEAFGSVEGLKSELTKAATALFGSGWVWLVEDATGKLSLLSTRNAGTPIRHGLSPLLCMDVWEHAYYIDYRNRRADAVAATWNLIDWKKVERRYKRIRK
ncbi:MAG: superoxide dismutase [Alistipes sp.]|nr:superoxide dismutase [Alistipes sp.]